MILKPIKKGIIVSIQGYSSVTTQELAENAESAGAAAIRTDKPINVKIPVIGLEKRKVANYKNMAYITSCIESISRVREWSDYVAIDYRFVNENLLKISDYCKKNEIPVIADIRGYADFTNIKNHDLYFKYVSTTFGIFDRRFNPDFSFIQALNNRFPGKIIGEGGYSTRGQVNTAFKAGAAAVCIGAAISDIYKLTKKFNTVDYLRQFDNDRKTE